MRITTETLFGFTKAPKASMSGRFEPLRQMVQQTTYHIIAYPYAH